MKHLSIILILVFGQINLFAQDSSANGWHINTCLKYDAFYFLNAISRAEFYNRQYGRDYTLWRGRLGAETVDSINTIVDSVGSIGFKASYLFTYLPISSLSDLIDILQDTARFSHSIQLALHANHDFRSQASLNDLKSILPFSTKLRFVFQQMRKQGWEEDWKTISSRLNVDITRKRVELTKYSPSLLKDKVDLFLGMKGQHQDSSATIYYVYYAFPNAFKLPYNMMATWNIENPQYFFCIYLHEMLHSFSIYSPEFRDLHKSLVSNSPKLNQNREILTNQLYESDDEFYILAAEAYLSVILGIRTDKEAVDYLKSADGGTVVYSLLIYNYLQKSFDDHRYSYGSFLKDGFFSAVNAQEVDWFLTDTK
jgi:hypothetical protein